MTRNQTSGKYREPNRKVIRSAEIVLYAAAGLLAVAGFVKILPALIRVPDQIDFGAYYLAAQLLNAHTPLYDYAEMANAAARNGGIDFTPYIYPPFLAALMRPIVSIPFNVAAPIWLIINLASLFVSIGLLLRIVGLSPTRFILPASVLALIIPASYGNLILGQINILLLLLLVGTLFFSVTPHQRENLFFEIVAGVLLGIAAGIKLYPAVLGWAFFLHRRCVSLAAMIITILMTFLIGIFLGNGWDNTNRFFASMLPSMGVPTNPSNQSIEAVSIRLFSPTQDRIMILDKGNGKIVTFNSLINAPEEGYVLGYLGAGIVAITTILTGFLKKRASLTKVFLFDYALMLTTILLINPIGWDIYYVFLLIPIVTLYQAYLELHSGLIRATLLILSLCMAIQRYWNWIAWYAPFAVLLEVGFFGVFSLWLSLLFLTFSEKKPPLTIRNGSQKSPEASLIS